MKNDTVPVTQMLGYNRNIASNIYFQKTIFFNLECKKLDAVFLL